MKEITGNLWDFISKPNVVICITTNGFVKRNGQAVMGRGCAKELADKVSHFPAMLGQAIQKNGNVVQAFGATIDCITTQIITFPVKHKWFDNADLLLIEKSAKELKLFADKYNDHTFYLPRPGCGNGNLRWEDVKPVIENILPDNVKVITYAPK